MADRTFQAELILTFSDWFDLRLLWFLLIPVAVVAYVYWRAWRMVHALFAARAAKDRGDFASARKFAQLALARSLTEVDTANALDELGDVHRFEGANAEAEKCYREALELRRQHLPPEHEDIGVSWHNVGLICFCIGKFAEAEEAFRLSYQNLSQARGENDPSLALTQGMQGMSLLCLGQFAVGAPLLEESLRRTEAGYGADHQRTADAWQRMGDCAGAMGRFGQGNNAFKRCQEILGRIHPDSDPLRNVVAQQRALLLIVWYRIMRDEAVLREADELMTKHYAALTAWLGTEHQLTSNAALVLARIRSEQGHLDEAVSLARDGLESASKILGNDHLRTAYGHMVLGRALLAAGQVDAAEQEIRQAIAINERGLGPTHFELGDSYEVLGIIAAWRGKHAAAEQHLLHSLKLDEPRGLKNPIRVLALRELTKVYQAIGNHAQAAAIEHEVTAISAEAKREWAESLTATTAPRESDFLAGKAG